MHMPMKPLRHPLELELGVAMPRCPEVMRAQLRALTQYNQKIVMDTWP
jgi:hypothetical protein